MASSMNSMIMNSTTFNSCVSTTSYDKAIYISNIIWYIVGFISIMFGIPGHIFQIIISLDKKILKDRTTLYFIAIAICEFIFLCGLFWLWCANMSIIKTDPRETLTCGVFFTILLGSTTLSNLYLASMAVDRSLMILRPNHYRLVVTQSHVLLRLILIFIIVLLLLIPHQFYFYYEPENTLFLCHIHSSANHQRIRVLSLIHTILFVSIPSLIVCISTFILLHNRCQHKRVHKQNYSQMARRIHRRSIFLFSVSLGIFLTLLPSCILEILIVYDRFFHHDRLCSIRWKIYKILLHCFFTFSAINYSMKFYLHLIISTSFRNNFLQLICCKTVLKKKTSVKSNTEQNLSPLMDKKKTKPVEL